MTAMITGFSRQGQRFTLVVRLRPLPGESRRALRAMFETVINEHVALARSTGATGIKRVTTRKWYRW